jgi:hypothetical protein
MTLRTLYRPTRFDRPVPRGWVIVGLCVVGWLVFLTAGYGLVSLVRGMLS